MTSRSNLMQLLQTKYPKMFLRTTEEFSGEKNGIWSSGETYMEAKDGFPLMDYYSENYKRYTFGVHSELHELLDSHGWFAEWYDPGTIMFWPN